MAGVNDSSSIQEQVSGLIKLAGMALIGSAIPVGVGVAVLAMKRQSGERAIVLCFAITAAMSALGFVLIWASKIAERYRRTGGNSQSPDE
jgi:hypothetical protein